MNGRALLDADPRELGGLPRLGVRVGGLLPVRERVRIGLVRARLLARALVLVRGDRLVECLPHLGDRPTSGGDGAGLEEEGACAESDDLAGRGGLGEVTRLAMLPARESERTPVQGDPGPETVDAVLAGESLGLVERFGRLAVLLALDEEPAQRVERLGHLLVLAESLMRVDRFPRVCEGSFLVALLVSREREGSIHFRQGGRIRGVL